MGNNKIHFRARNAGLGLRGEAQNQYRCQLNRASEAFLIVAGTSSFALWLPTAR
jgi:hypothetical protein